MELRIFDVSGRLVRTLVDAPLAHQKHEVVWDGIDAAGHRVGSGVYLYRLRAGDFVQTRRMVVLK